jgi:biopolymer transport protein ExbB
MNPFNHECQRPFANDDGLSTLLGRLILLAVLLTAGVGSAQSLEELAAKQQLKLEDALTRLAAQRETIESEQIPLARRLNELEAEARVRRAALKESQAVRDSRGLDITTLQSQVESRRTEYDFIVRDLFSDYIANYQSALSAGEQATRGEAVRELHLKLEDREIPESERLAGMLAVVSDSITRLESALSVRRYDGEAVATDGELVPGRFIQAGPLLYFSGTAAENTGWVEENKSLRPAIRKLDDETVQQIRAFADGGTDLLPVDPSLGNALAVEATRETVLEHLRKGGVWVYPIVLFALVATLVAVAKMFQIFTLREPAPGVVYQMVKAIREGDVRRARALAEAQPRPSSDLLVSAVDHSGESLELVEEVMYESMLNVQPGLERYLNIIAVTASTAPLLGLLGTVTGIIKTFKLMEVYGAGDPKPLISGISEALITTELGLVLAIPALIIHALLARRVAGILARMEKLSVAFLNGLSRESTKVQ